MDRSLLAARIQEILKGRPKPAQAQVPSGGANPPSTCGGNPSTCDGDVPSRCGANLPVGDPCDEEAAFAARCAADAASSDAADVLGGEVIEGPAGRAFVVDRCYPLAFRHGRRTVEEYASATAGGLSTLSAFLAAPGSGDRASAAPVFFDLETTGLSGGAGTYAFLVGCGYFEGGEFRTRQFFLRGFGEELALLEAVRAFLEEKSLAGTEGPTAERSPAPGTLPAASCLLPAAVRPCLVTYNGKAFDLPLIETRYLFHRRTSPFVSLPHADMLFAARRLWKRRDAWRDAEQVWREASASREVWRDAGQVRREPEQVWREPSGSRSGSSCALTALEQDILGFHRQDDVPGWEIPSRYFGYTRTGDAKGLVAVLEHNRLDLLSLAAVTAVILEMVVEQESVVRGAADALALARLLEYLGRVSDAERCYERAARRDGLVEGEADRVVRAEALHWLALQRRRARRFPEAAEAWQAIVEIPGVDPALRREACEALAIHHEHRARDFTLARAFALRALDVARGGRHQPDVEHRLDRLSRKLRARRPADDSPTQAAFPVDDPAS